MGEKKEKEQVLKQIKAASKNYNDPKDKEKANKLYQVAASNRDNLNTKEKKVHDDVFKAAKDAGITKKDEK